MTGDTQATERRTLLPTAVGWIALIALDAYATFLHQGLGQAPGGYAFEWWHPTSFLWLHPTVGGWSDVPAMGTAILSAPALVLMAVVFLGTRSAIARALAVSLFVISAAFCFAGFTADGLWQSFHWRLSAVLVWIGLAIGFAIMSPALSASWLRRGWLLRIGLYVPIAFAITAVIRNATGTDESLAGNFSPWPGVSVLGLEMGAYTIVGGLLGLALGLGALTQWSKRPVVALAGVLAGAVFPAMWFYARFSNTEAGPLVMIAILAAIALGLAAVTRGGERSATLTRRAAHFALGATLVFAPLFTGRAWANADYTINKFVRARIASDALAEYYAKEGVYPDSLGELTAQGYLEELPRPRVGFDFLYDLGLLEPIKFSYRGLGSSYVLEFVSTEWVQCAYNPPWAAGAGAEYDDEEYEEEYGDADDESGEAWSCPSTRPELWGNDDEYEEYREEYEEALRREYEEEYDEEYEEEYDEEEEE